MDWAGTSISARATTLGLTEEYDTLYWDVCQMKHASPAASSRTVAEQGGYVDMMKGPSISGVSAALWYSTSWLMPQLLRLNQHFALGLKSELEDSWLAFKTAVEQLLAKHPDLIK